MDILAILLIAVAATVDSFIVGFGFGLKRVRIGNWSNLFISLFCLLGTMGSMLLGRYLGSVVPVGLTDVLGGLLLLCFGLYMLYSALMPPKEGICTRASDPFVVDKDQSNVVELREAFLMGLMLCLNNMGLGIGAGIAGYSVILTPLICAATSFAFLKLGSACGKRLVREGFGKALEVVSSIVVILLGVYAFF